MVHVLIYDAGSLPEFRCGDVIGIYRELNRLNERKAALLHTAANQSNGWVNLRIVSRELEG